MESGVITANRPTAPRRFPAPLVARTSVCADMHQPSSAHYRSPNALPSKSDLLPRGRRRTVILSTARTRPPARLARETPNGRASPVSRSILAGQKKTSAIKAAKRTTIIETDGRTDRREGTEDEMKERTWRRIGRRSRVIGVVKCQVASLRSSWTNGVHDNVSGFNLITISNAHAIWRSKYLHVFIHLLFVFIYTSENDLYCKRIFIHQQ